MNENIIIRKFEDKDRAAVRKICCDTADRGEPIERFFPDREVAADLLTGYYTDYEPSSTFVGEFQAQVVDVVQFRRQDQNRHHAMPETRVWFHLLHQGV